MQQANRPKIALVGDISRYSLIGLLIINILSPFAILFIEPEAFFLGQKIAETDALVYALGLFLVTALLMFCLSQKIKGNEVIALVYGVIYFINGYLIVLDNGVQFPPAIYWLILVLSIVLFGVMLVNQWGKSAGNNEKNISTIFTEKPFAGLLLSVGVFLCFIIFILFSSMSYTSEHNTYLYQIEIYPETPLQNVTLMMPLPPGITQNITAGDLIGNYPRFLTNYSQSVVETENGTLLKITADSIEKPHDGPEESVTLYQSFFVTDPINFSTPLDHAPVLLPKFSLEPALCTEKNYQRTLSEKNPLNCSVYRSTIYAVFKTAPSSRTMITVSFDGTRSIWSKRFSEFNGYQDSISVAFSGNASGWYNATGTLLAG